MMFLKKIGPFILPFLILSVIILQQAEILHIGCIYIKSHELKWTELAMDYFPREGDIFTAGEQVSNNNYEAGLFAINPDYDTLLDRDMHKIADNRTQIDMIDHKELSFHSGPYKIIACLEKKHVAIKDSTFFMKLVTVDILGKYELYKKGDNKLLYEIPGRKFWIRDSIVIRGRSTLPFIKNKVNEIYIAQMSNNAYNIIDHYHSQYGIPAWAKESLPNDLQINIPMDTMSVTLP